MEPPWVKFSYIPADTLGWEVGRPNAYLYKFTGWFRSLADKEQVAFRQQYIEPDTWEGYLQSIIDLGPRRICAEAANDCDYRLYSIADEWEDDERFDDAAELFGWMARLNYQEAQSRLAILFDDYVTPRQPGKAVYWMKRAIRNGSTLDVYNLAVHHRGLGHRKGHIFWLKKAAEIGDESAIDDLRAMMSATGPTA